MNDNTKNVSQNTPPPIPAVAPSAPVGTINKETGHIASPVSEFIKPTEAEPRISQKLKESGVEVKSDKPDLTFEHKELGMDHAGPHVPVSILPSSSIQYPMSEEEITDKLKTGQNDDSGKWLAGLLQKIIRVIGL